MLADHVPEGHRALLWLSDVAAGTGRSVETVRDHVKRGLLGVRRQGSRYLVTHREYLRYKAELQRKPPRRTPDED